MLYALSSSIFLLVAGSTVRASPIFPVLAADPLSSVATASASALSTQVGQLVVENETGGVFIAATTAATTSQSRHTTTATHTAVTTSKASIHLTTSKPTATGGSKGGAGGSTITVPISTPTSVQTSLASASVTHAATASAKATVRPTAGSGSSNNGTALAPGSSCDGTNDGSVVCSADGTLFGLCNFGEAVMMPVSKGTACRNGAIDYIADTLGVALGQVKSYLDSSDNATSLYSAADPSAVDASDCPSALLYLKDAVDGADKVSDSSETALRLVNSDGKTVVDNSDVELVMKSDGTAGFQVRHQCGGNGTGSSKRQLWFEICLL